MNSEGGSERGMEGEERGKERRKGAGGGGGGGAEEPRSSSMCLSRSCPEGMRSPRLQDHSRGQGRK